MGFLSGIGKAIGSVVGGPVGGIIGGIGGGILDGVFGNLFKMDRSPVEDALSQLTQLVGRVREEAFNPIQQIAQEVTDGGVWTGAGADAFVNGVSEMALPSIGRIGDNIESMNQSLRKAMDRMDQADMDGEKLFYNALQGLFRQII